MFVIIKCSARLCYPLQQFKKNVDHYLENCTEPVDITV